MICALFSRQIDQRLTGRPVSLSLFRVRALRWQTCTEGRAPAAVIGRQRRLARHAGSGRSLACAPSEEVVSLAPKIGACGAGAQSTGRALRRLQEVHITKTPHMARAPTSRARARAPPDGDLSHQLERARGAAVPHRSYQVEALFLFITGPSCLHTGIRLKNIPHRRRRAPPPCTRPAAASRSVAS